MGSIEPLPAPTYVIWEVTLACNLRCKHCGASAGRRRSDELSTSEALSVCDDLKALGTGSVCLMGGEVVLRKDWLRIAARLRELGVDVGIITNGFSFSEELVKRVLDLGLCQLGTSLDGANARIHDGIRGVPGAHERARAFMRRLNELPVRLKTVITSVNKNNLGELPGIRDWLLANTSGFTWMINISSCHDAIRFGREELVEEEDYFALAAFIDENRTRHRGQLNITGTHDLGYFSREYPNLHDFRWRGCSAGIETLGIQSHGAVKGCLALPDEFVEGNVRERSLRDLWRDPGLFALNRAFRTDLLEGGCRGCPMGARCRAGCRDVAVSYTGSPYSYPFCLYRRERREKDKAEGELRGGDDELHGGDADLRGAEAV
jgi:radical SAM protein with 4Fe4S-binding SPASM domain